MTSRFLSYVGGLALVLLSTSCKTTSSEAEVKSDAATSTPGACAPLDAKTDQPADLGSDSSVFATLVLKPASLDFTPSTGRNPKCPTTIHEVLSLFDKLPGSFREVFMVDEIGDQGKQGGPSIGGHRFVIAQDPGSGPGNGVNSSELFFAPTERPAGKLDTSALEVIAYDPGREANNFYKFMDGHWYVMGNGTQIDPQKSQEATADKRSFPCQACHPTGALNFKERRKPWTNWADGLGTNDGGEGQDFSMAYFRAPNDPLLDLWGRAAQPGARAVVGTGYQLEGNIQLRNQTLVAARVKHVLAGDRSSAFPGQSLKTLMREVLCEVGEVNLTFGNSGGRPPAQTFLFPLINQEFSDLLFDRFKDGLPPVDIDADAYRAAVQSQRIAGFPNLHDNFHSLVQPDRSSIAEFVASELIKAGWLDQESWSDILMTDFPTRVFSKQRCNLVATLPDTAGMAPVDFVPAWAAKLATSDLPGAKGLAKRLLTPGERQDAHHDRVGAFLKACALRSKTDPRAFVTDMLTIAQQHREELRQDAHLNRGNQGFPQIIESPALFPIPAQPVQPYAVFLQENCTLAPTPAEINPL